MAMTTEAVAVMAAATKNNTPKLSSASHPTDTKAAVTAIKMIVVFFMSLWYYRWRGDSGWKSSPFPLPYRFPLCFRGLWEAVFFLGSFLMLNIKAIVAMILLHTVSATPIHHLVSTCSPPFIDYIIARMRVYFKRIEKKVAQTIRITISYIVVNLS